MIKYQNTLGAFQRVLVFDLQNVMALIKLLQLIF